MKIKTIIIICYNVTLSILPLAVHVAVVVLVEPPAHQVGQEHHHHHTRQDAAHNDGDEVIGLSNGAVRGGLKSNKTKYFRLRLTDEVSSERPKV